MTSPRQTGTTDRVGPRFVDLTDGWSELPRVVTLPTASVRCCEGSSRASSPADRPWVWGAGDRTYRPYVGTDLSDGRVQ
jgi:hypothetical protein